ncbi:cadherin repeat domain-containing protein, partial [Gammaproteobacteria bacterium]|nr:cadherin repeat domain-containing protein [Gammaproteobacteria bacterium]
TFSATDTPNINVVRLGDVDGDFDPSLITDHAPILTGKTTLTVDENETTVSILVGSDADGDTLTYSITGGVDKDLFSINESTGVLSFKAGPDYEDPSDAGFDNLYDVEISVSDGTNTTMQALVVSIGDVGETWIQRGASVYGKEACDNLGRMRISDDGNTLVVGMSKRIVGTGGILLDEAGNCTSSAPIVGGVRVFDWNGSSWSQRGDDFIGNNEDGTRDTNLGYARGISKDKNTIIIGAFLLGEDEDVRVWDWDSDNNTWKQRGMSITADRPDGPDGPQSIYHGGEVSISDNGNSIAVSTPRAALPDEYLNGLTRVFDWDGNAWVQRGDTIWGKDFEYLGRNAQLSGDSNTIVISATFNSDNFQYGGAVYIYEWNGSAWVQRGNTIYGKQQDELLGGYHGLIDIDDDITTIVIGSHQYKTNVDDPNPIGEIRVYDWDGNDWVERSSTSTLEGSVETNIGYYVSLSADGNILSTGSSGIDAKAFVYVWTNNQWVQRGTVPDLDTTNTTTYASLSEDGKTIGVGGSYLSSDENVVNDFNGLHQTGKISVFDWKE